MRRLLFYFLVLLLAVWLGLKMQADPGYVLIAYHKVSMETTLWFAVALLLVLVFIWYFLLKIIGGTKILPRRLRHWWHNHKERKAIQLTNIGILKLVEEDFSLAEKCLSKAASASPNAFFNYCQAAYAAEQQGAFLRRDHYFKQAHYMADQREEFALGVMQARSQMRGKQWEQALANLKKLYELKPKQKILLKLLERVYFAIADWRSLYELLPAIAKAHILTAEEFNQLEKQISLELLQNTISGVGEDKAGFQIVNRFWQELPKRLWQDGDLVSCYVKYLLLRQEHDRAEELLRLTLNHAWQPPLVVLYSEVISSDPIGQLAAAEKWLASYPEDAKLLFALGKLCKRQTLWGKARSYFEKSLKIMAQPATYFELGQIMEAEGDIRAAMEYYRRSYTL